MKCQDCDTPVEAEKALAIGDGIFRCQHGCAPKVEFFPERICDSHKRCTPGSANCADPPCRDRHYTIDGERQVNGLDIISVTTITKEVGDRFPQGAWWGQGVGAEGTRALRALGYLPEDATQDDIVDLLKKHKRTVNHVKDSAAQRGTDVHQLGEDWAKGGDIPSGNGWADALAKFIEIEQPHPLDAEILVGSRKGAYAGQSDLLAHFPKLDAIGLVDYKSKTKPPKGKPVAYEQNHLQLAGYEEARVEMGYIPSDFQCVVNLYPDGTYALIQNRATPVQWWSAVHAYRSLAALRNAIKAAD